MMRGRRRGDLTALEAAICEEAEVIARVHEEIFRANREGSSLRAIAEVSGRSHETVNKIIKDIEKSIEIDQKTLSRPIGAYSPSAREAEEARRRRLRTRIDRLLGVKKPDDTYQQ
jgi:hypothetical protein